MGVRIPPLQIKLTLESNPLKSTMLVGEPQRVGPQRVTPGRSAPGATRGAPRATAAAAPEPKR